MVGFPLMLGDIRKKLHGIYKEKEVGESRAALLPSKK